MNHPLTMCDSYRKQGAGVMLLGLGLFFTGAIIAATAPPSGGGRASPPPAQPPDRSPVQPLPPRAEAAPPRQFAAPERDQGANAPPPAQAVGRNPNGSTTTTIRNNTPYALRVSTAGLTFVVAAGAAQTITVYPGSYLETVEALGSTIPPYRGLQSYERGIDYDETYVIVRQP